MLSDSFREPLSGPAGYNIEKTPSLPVPDPGNDATREKQIPFRNGLARDQALAVALPP